MVDYPDDWHHALELLAGSANGCTALVLVAQGFPSTVIARLVDSNKSPGSHPAGQVSLSLFEQQSGKSGKVRA
jgi:hypothetical protein